MTDDEIRAIEQYADALLGRRKGERSRSNMDAPKRYRPRQPREVEAMHYKGENWHAVAVWLTGRRIGVTFPESGSELTLHTSQGALQVRPGEVIVLDSETRKLTVQRERTFEAMFEVIE